MSSALGSVFFFPHRERFYSCLLESLALAERRDNTFNARLDAQPHDISSFCNMQMFCFVSNRASHNMFRLCSPLISLTSPLFHFTTNLILHSYENRTCNNAEPFLNMSPFRFILPLISFCHSISPPLRLEHVAIKTPWSLLSMAPHCAISCYCAIS